VILVDTCVLIDLASGDPHWADWSAAQLDSWSKRGPLIINGMVYAELASGFDSIEMLESFVTTAELDLRAPGRAALYLAGRARSMYRRLGGTRSGLLPDFVIGAHAADLGCPILTRDPTRFRSYFRKLQLICP
jgi:predicted nucleic acid-binding protein